MKLFDTLGEVLDAVNAQNDSISFLDEKEITDNSYELIGKTTAGSKIFAMKIEEQLVYIIR